MGIYILNARRSPIGRFNGNLSNITCVELSTYIIEEMLKQSNIKKDKIDEVIVGNVLSANQGQNIARQIIINGKFPIECCGYTINMVCGSGMKSIVNAFSNIKANQANCIIAGGVENMSKAPYLIQGNNMDEIEQIHKQDIISHMLKDSLTDAFTGKHMGITAENLAEKYNINRNKQDEYAYNSHMKAKMAIENEIFDNEIIPIYTKEGKKISSDEHVRKDCNLIKLSKLEPIFKKGGTVTAGNCSGINDGASFMIISNEKMIEQGYTIYAEIVEYAQIGVEPEFMGMGAYAAICKLLEKTNMKISDIDLFEINEAFSVQILAVINELTKKYNYSKEILTTKVNVSGGAIALGHPLGASGARIITTLITNLKKRNLKYGIASTCIGGGMGIAILIKNV